MVQRDYILRMIEELGAALIALRKAIFGGTAPAGEVENTLRRAAIWSGGSVITSDELRDALLSPARDHDSDVLSRPLGNGFSLPDLLAEVARHYLSRAIGEAANNKTRAAELVGLASYQTFTNWLSKYGTANDGTVLA